MIFLSYFMIILSYFRILPLLQSSIINQLGSKWFETRPLLFNLDVQVQLFPNLPHIATKVQLQFRIVQKFIRSILFKCFICTFRIIIQNEYLDPTFVQKSCSIHELLEAIQSGSFWFVFTCYLWLRIILQLQSHLILSLRVLNKDYFLIKSRMLEYIRAKIASCHQTLRLKHIPCIINQHFRLNLLNRVSKSVKFLIQAIIQPENIAA